jgi:hypothetical protein
LQKEVTRKHNTLRWQLTEMLKALDKAILEDSDTSERPEQPALGSTKGSPVEG